MQKSPVILDRCLSKAPADKSRDVIVFETELRFQNVTVYTKSQGRCFQNPPVERAFLKSSVLDGLGSTVGLSGEIKLRFQISPA